MKRLSKHVKATGFADDALSVLRNRDFPGNIRELQHVVERLAWLAEGPMITSIDLGNEHRHSVGQKQKFDERMSDTSENSNIDSDDLPKYKIAKQKSMNIFEQNYLVKLLSLTGNNLLRAALYAGLQRHSLRELLKKHGLYSVKE